MSNDEYGRKGYDVKLSMPIRYENLLRKKDDPGGFVNATKHIEYYIRKTGDEIKHASNVKANMTEWRTHQKNIHFMRIANAALFLCQEGMKTKYPLEIGDCWGALYKKGEHTISHHHFPFTWSFTYYVKVSEHTAPLIFENVMNPQDKSFVNMPIQPKKGDLFIFPSQLRHSVPKQETDDERIMVAGNIWYNFKSENIDIAKINSDCKYILQDDYEKISDSTK